MLTRVRHYLTQPRGALYYDLTSLPGQQGNSPIINIPSGRDDGTGPWPDAKGFQIKYTTQDTLLVNWSCTVKLRDCGNPNVATAPLSLRWVDSIAWGADWRATYTRNGTLILSSLSNQNADWYRRNKLAPPIPFGFRRTSSKYTVSSDFLRCDFSMTDEQIRFGPPADGVTMNIVQSESAPIGPIRKGSVSVSIGGIQNSTPVDLSRWALIIMSARVQAAGPLVAGANGATSLLGVVNLETRESESDMSVTASCSYKTNPNQARQVALVGNVAGAWATAAGGAQQAAAGNRNTQQGRPVGLAKFPWVGFGTTPPSQFNPGGFASWANPSAAVGGPADGVGLAQAVSLFAAALNDPCGFTELASPAAAGFQTELRTQPNQYNTPTGGGAGGTSPTASSSAQVQVSLSNIPASMYPSTVSIDTADALWTQDGQPGVYEHWQVSDEYAEDPGTMVASVCNSEGGVNRQIDFSSDALTLFRRWTAKRSGAKPTLPPKVVNLPSGAPDPNWIFVGGSPSPAIRDLGLGSDGVNFDYEASGVWIFQSLDPAAANILAMIPPFLDPTVSGTVAGWFNGAQLVAEGGGAGGGAGGGGGSPLGGGSLPSPIPP